MKFINEFCCLAKPFYAWNDLQLWELWEILHNSIGCLNSFSAQCFFFLLFSLLKKTQSYGLQPFCATSSYCRLIHDRSLTPFFSALASFGSFISFFPNLLCFLPLQAESWNSLSFLSSNNSNKILFLWLTQTQWPSPLHFTHI